MTNQEKKKWLKRYTELNRAINQRLDEMARLKSLCEKVTTTFSDMPKGGENTREDKYIRLIELRDEANGLTDMYADMKGEIETAINTVDDITLKTLLRYRYINGYTWEKIAVEMNYCYKQICRLHGKALILIEL